jgi:putative FmdB family regulatory protein
MPIYEYRCSSCGHELEGMQKFSDPVLKRCPQCSNDALVKLVSAAGFQLKGGGWYATDFRGSGSKPATKSDGKSDGGESKSDGKTDSSESKSDGATEGKAKPAGGCGGGCACH